ncbi:transposase IS4 family protein [Crinalium epipsammum PCC 9333]|uniref:Transposase IS4 family protein n=1 Tax=Crinalium epipsammum PCC 9333 TaxID=1173022 RepID=K9W0B5_9CYAN|nr:ISAs1 family transposase [Crinalium epipsammum]AFZ11656.1 transposase IS4 family protein [Crinalium epipsammum PCC 9333]AFZ13651.1 transposase IS4 family protein [Crinalium epipsammum PCC 9333]AFZ14043.1 transposase IS4 family protein [Crinalium epipsammum PCC 9333]AFZ14601.1 transposase IS4 family protein [Crinalium epipsammum PCC 9333]AFZ15024.1 transposase IS4 family protein [Crinalium epipsammum PCC 9333]
MLVSLIEHLKKVKDFRKSQGKRHPLWIVLLVVVLGMMSGYQGYREIGHFVKYEQRNLINNLEIFTERLPSCATIRRVMMGMDWQNLSEVFNQWAKENYPQIDETDWLAIDGKSLRSTVTNYADKSQNFGVIVSVFSQLTGLVIALSKIENKSKSEIAEVQDIVRNCGFKGKVISADALHCNQTTTRAIIKSQNNYLIALKKNQNKLYEQVKTLTNMIEPSSRCITKEQSHGRQVTREVTVFNNIIKLKNWSHIQSLIKVERWGWRGSSPYQETVYYISSMSADAETFNQRIRGHWRIENQVHWVKDVILNEDKMKIHQIQAATNFSILKTIVLNLFRGLGFISITEGKRWLGNHWNKLLIMTEELT